jgi:hypothetical protein
VVVEPSRQDRFEIPHTWLAGRQPEQDSWLLAIRGEAIPSVGAEVSTGFQRD